MDLSSEQFSATPNRTAQVVSGEKILEHPRKRCAANFSVVRFTEKCVEHGRICALFGRCRWRRRNRRLDGGEGGIRTPGRVSPTPVFKTGAINHSATSPWLQFTACARTGESRKVYPVRQPCDLRGGDSVEFSNLKNRSRIGELAGIRFGSSWRVTS